MKLRDPTSDAKGFVGGGAGLDENTNKNVELQLGKQGARNERQKVLKQLAMLLLHILYFRGKYYNGT